jgi:hypothetical protein
MKYFTYVHMDLSALAQSAARSFHNIKVAVSVPPTGACTGGSNIFIQFYFLKIY